jgi:MerR family Zn(II)-responsive transcriptional regulator of zntA
MRISELADTVQLSVDTIRFYERRGLLDAEHFSRRSNNYRDYSETAIARLLLVRQGQAAGLTLSEIGGSIKAWESHELTAAQKNEFFGAKLDEIDTRMRELQRLRQYLTDKLTSMGEPVRESVRDAAEHEPLDATA